MSAADFSLQKSARLIKLVRKAYHKTQEQMAQELSITQSCLSKFEAAKLGPSAIQWMTFCHNAHIHPEAIFSGVIDGFNAKSLRKKIGPLPFKVPPKYHQTPGLSVRFLRPLLEQFEQGSQASLYQRVLKKLNIDAEILLILDEELSWNFVEDLFVEMKIKPKELNQFFNKNFLFGEQSWGELFTELEKKKTQLDKVSFFLEKMFKEKSVQVRSDLEKKHHQIKLSLPHFWKEDSSYSPIQIPKESGKSFFEQLLDWQIHSGLGIETLKSKSRTQGTEGKEIIFTFEERV